MLHFGGATTQLIAIKLPSDRDRLQARNVLARLAQDASGLRLQDLPEGVSCLVQSILSEVALDHAVQRVPVDAELGTQEAADLLGASRPHLVRLIDEGKLISWKVGTHRQVKLQDLLVCRDRRDTEHQQALQELGLL